MNTPESRAFYEVIEASVTNFSDIKTFIEKETSLGGKKWSWDEHEYQEYIVKILQARPGCEAVVRKNSQIGLSELFYRYFLAKMAINPGTSLMLSFPSKLASSEAFKTRVDPIIDNSTRLSSMMSNSVDSASVKLMVNGSVAYALAGSGSSKQSLLSRYVSCCMVDELDRQDPLIYNSFGSRMVHAKEKDKLTVKISTPTIENYGIEAELDECRELHTPYIICEHCQHEFYPDYFEHVRLPGYTQNLKSLTRTELAKLDPYSAYFECPECKGEIKERNYIWKIEHRATGVLNKIGFVLNPFIAKFIKIHDLVIDSVKFDSISEFYNQRLGLPYTEKSSQITRDSIRIEKGIQRPGRMVLGIDFGKTVYLTVGRVHDDTSIHVTELHIVMLHEFRTFLKELTSRIVFTSIVADAQPYSEMIYSLVQEYPRFFSAIYVDPTIPKPGLYSISMLDKHDQLVRQVEINKTMFFDNYSNALINSITFEPSPLDEILITHLTSMKRVKDYERQIEDGIRYKWVKASGNADDHFHHSGIYMFAAAKLALTDLFYAPQVPFSINKINPTLAKARQDSRNMLPYR